MNTQAQVQRLEAGQALPLPRRSAGPAVLTQGELLVQAPARWLGETLIVPAPLRIVAPAVLPAGVCAVIAVRASSVTVHEAEPLLVTASAWVRGLLRLANTRGRQQQMAG